MQSSIFLYFALKFCPLSNTANMKNIHVIILILGTCMTFASQSQDMTIIPSSAVKKTNSLNVSFGIHQIREEILTPKVQRGYLFLVAYNRERLSLNRLSGYRFELAYSRAKTKYEDLPATVYINFLFQYDYSFKLADHNKFQYFLGPLGRLNYSLDVYPTWDDSHMYWGNYLSVGIKNTFLYEISSDKIMIAKVELPVISVSSRPESNRLYKMDDTSLDAIITNWHSNIQAGSIETVFFLTTDFDYLFRMTSKTMESVGFSVQYLRIKSHDGEPFNDLYYLIALKIYF